MWKRLNSNQMCEQFSYKEVFLIKRFLIERFYSIYIYIYIYIYINNLYIVESTTSNIMYSHYTIVNMFICSVGLYSIVQNTITTIICNVTLM